MKTNISHLSNLEFLFNLGFSGVTGNKFAFVKTHGVSKVRVLFLENGKVQVSSSFKPNRARTWTCFAFPKAVELLGTLGIE